MSEIFPFSRDGNWRPGPTRTAGAAVLFAELGHREVIGHWEVHISKFGLFSWSTPFQPQHIFPEYFFA
jgi:hypothetical protein